MEEIIPINGDVIPPIASPILPFDVKSNDSTNEGRVKANTAKKQKIIIKTENIII